MRLRNQKETTKGMLKNAPTYYPGGRGGSCIQKNLKVEENLWEDFLNRLNREKRKAGGQKRALGELEESGGGNSSEDR